MTVVTINHKTAYDAVLFDHPKGYPWFFRFPDGRWMKMSGVRIGPVGVDQLEAAYQEFKRGKS